MKNAKRGMCKFTLSLILAFGVFSCGDNKQRPTEEKPVVVEAPQNIITLAEADALYNNYTKHRIPLITNYEIKQRAPSEKFEAARFVDFDYDSIKKYISYIDQEAANGGVKKVTKLRLYFANYPNEKKFKDEKDVVHPRQNSIFILPTLEKNNQDYGFYIGENGKAELILDWNSGIEKGMGSLNMKKETQHAGIIPNFFTSNSAQAGKSLTYNHGNGGPPPPGDF
jgi:hypothetical protein